MPNAIRPSKLGALDQKFQHYNTDDRMSILEFDPESLAARIDQQWYSILFAMNDAAGHAKYPLLATLTKAALSAFSGPIVKGSFTLMDGILEKDRSNMTPQNFESLLKIKMHLKVSNKNALTYPISLQMRRSI